MSVDVFKSKDYRKWLEEIKDKVHSLQIKAATAVNQELLTLYWEIGKMIAEMQEKSGWGDAVVEKLSKDLKKEFPDMKGFSRANLFFMRQWFLFYYKAEEKVQQLVRQIPWGHNVLIMNKMKVIHEAEFYIKATIEFNWSRSVLLHQIETRLYERKKNLTHNFKRTLPVPQSDLATQMLKDPYVFDFLTIDEKEREKEIEKELIKHIIEFLLELGVGFSFVANQYHLEVGDEDFYIDLLFYHLKLRCYVAVELKKGSFKPEYAGKINFYLSALDDLVKTEHDNPSIGIVLCQTKNRLIAEYALRDMSKPIGVSNYQLTEALPKEFKSSLPTIEELEAELSGYIIGNKSN